MIQNYVLVDFENIQPTNIELLKNHNFKLIIFVGSNQKNISFEIAEIVQSFGNNAEYVKINGNGKNALDFHIAFYIGKFSEMDKNLYFYIISKDTGFDSLISYLRTLKIKIQRVEYISKIPILQIPNILNLKTIDEKIEEIKRKFLSQSNNPATEKTLKSSINNLFQKTLNEKELNIIIKELLNRNIIKINENKINYFLSE